MIANEETVTQFNDSTSLKIFLSITGGIFIVYVCLLKNVTVTSIALTITR
ncbi:hypothetical protein GQ473_01260 [archaeon]|nr:hypothetical protein [archaeon]